MATDPNQAARVKAAWIYYVEGRTQQEVAAALGLNRVAVTRLLSEARRRGEVVIHVQSPLAEVVELERALETRYQLSEAIVAPLASAGDDPVPVIAAAAGAYVDKLMRHHLTVGVGWGRTLYASLPLLRARALDDVRVISLLGGIAEAKRYNPAEFAWQFAEAFSAEGFLIPAPALVDSEQTKRALLERCGLNQIFAMAARSDVALISAGGIASSATSYRFGHLSEHERLSLVEHGAVGDVLYNFIDASGNVIDHPVNQRAVSLGLDDLARIPRRVLISGGAEKVAVMRAIFASIKPTALITDQFTARALLG